MIECERLFPARNISAFFSTQQRALIISAQVTVNPFSDLVRICRNPLEKLLPTPAAHEYIIVGTTRPGIHPDLVVELTISGSFHMDATPKTVAVYSMGIDNPDRTEISVGAEPTTANPPERPTTSPASGTTVPGAPLEATGWSKDFILQDAFSNAVTELRTKAGFRNPDIGLAFEMVAAGGQVGGFTLNTGVFVKVRTA